MTLTLTPVTDRPPAYNAPGDTVSLDGVWTFTHELAHDGTQVVATHLATGLARVFPTHDDAVAWTVGGRAIADLIGDAVDEATGLTFPEAKAEARAALIRLGALLPAGTEVEHRCGCGGYLALGPARTLVHVDTCEDEVWGWLQVTRTRATRPAGRRTVTDIATRRADRHDCPDAAGHKVCPTPEAVQCDHIQCHAPNAVFALPCERGYDSCSGCCTQEG